MLGRWPDWLLHFRSQSCCQSCRVFFGSSGEESASRLIPIGGRIQFLAAIGLRCLCSGWLSASDHFSFRMLTSSRTWKASSPTSSVVSKTQMGSLTLLISLFKWIPVPCQGSSDWEFIQDKLPFLKSTLSCNVPRHQRYSSLLHWRHH